MRAANESAGRQVFRWRRLAGTWRSVVFSAEIVLSVGDPRPADMTRLYAGALRLTPPENRRRDAA